MDTPTTLKALVREIATLAERYLPLERMLSPDLISWAEFHGWEPSAISTHRLLVRQALLNTLTHWKVEKCGATFFPSPLDGIPVDRPRTLTELADKTLNESSQHIFNIWGDLHQILIPQAERRRIGQFWTGELVAEWMVAWLLQFRPQQIADIGCGAGNFLLKASQLLAAAGASHLCGLDVSPLMTNLATAAIVRQQGDQPRIQPILAVRDFLETGLPEGTDAAICNPPYTRHHHISPQLKAQQQFFCKQRLQLDISRQATLASYFLLRIIAELPDGAHCAVITPMEVLDARYGAAAKRALSQHTKLEAIINFSPKMNAFQKVDVGASILLFRKGYTANNELCHLTLDTLPETSILLNTLRDMRSGTRQLSFGRLTIKRQDDLNETSKWFSLVPTPERRADGLIVRLKEVAKVVRGIATGANDFFVLTSQQVRQYSLEPYVVRTIHRNREVQHTVLDEVRWQALADEGKCVWLLYLSRKAADAKPELQRYLKAGEHDGYHQRSLVQTRRHWYMMEQREIPPIIFTLLTRGNPRFILNKAGVRPVNMFLLIYPNKELISSDSVEILWALLNSHFSLSRLHSVSRTYGGNTLKVEPRELDNLPIIDPLALPEEARQRIKKQIADFHVHQEMATLTREVDAVIDTLIVAPVCSERRRLTPTQLSLLE